MHKRATNRRRMSAGSVSGGPRPPLSPKVEAACQNSNVRAHSAKGLIGCQHFSPHGASPQHGNSPIMLRLVPLDVGDVRRACPPSCGPAGIAKTETVTNIGTDRSDGNIESDVADHTRREKRDAKQKGRSWLPPADGCSRTARGERSLAFGFAELAAPCPASRQGCPKQNAR